MNSEKLRVLVGANVPDGDQIAARVVSAKAQEIARRAGVASVKIRSFAETEVFDGAEKFRCLDFEIVWPAPEEVEVQAG